MLKQKLALTQNQGTLTKRGIVWIKPLREWVLSLKEATFVASSDDLCDIKRVIQKVGLNPTLLDKKINLRFRQPYALAAEILAQTAVSSSSVSEKNFPAPAKNTKSSPWWRCRELNPGPTLIYLPIIHKISQFEIL